MFGVVLVLAMPMVFLTLLVTIIVSVPLEAIIAPEAVTRTDLLSGKRVTEVMVVLSPPAAVDNVV